ASVWGIIPFTISSPANGMAQGALDAFLDDMKVREGSYDHSPLSKKPGMHLVVAEAGAMIDAAELLYRRSFTETIDKIMAGRAACFTHPPSPGPSKRSGRGSRCRSSIAPAAGATRAIR